MVAEVDTVRFDVEAVPLTVKSAPGLAVPIPTLPLASTVKKVEVAVPAVVEAMVRSGVLAAVLRLFERERREYGEVVPMPMFPIELTKILVVACAVPASFPTTKLPFGSAFEIGVYPKRDEEAKLYREPLRLPTRPEVNVEKVEEAFEMRPLVKAIVVPVALPHELGVNSNGTGVKPKSVEEAKE